MIRRPPRSTHCISSAASDVYKRQLPWLCGAVMASVGGYTCDTLCARLGPRWGCRIPAITGLLGAGLFLYAGLYASSPYSAVALLSLCFASTQLTEGAYWSAQTYVAGPYTAPACGVMNTGGNLAGIVVAPLMPYLASHVGWVKACLLYTSPSPRDKRQSRMPSSA